MDKIMVRVSKPKNNPHMRLLTKVYDTEEEAMEAIRQMDKEGVSTITVWELKKRIDL